jgi:hypothetical protein
MPMCPDGIERPTSDRTGERYFITDTDGVERETDAAGFIQLERSCGFRHKPGCGPFATGGFSSGKREGRIERMFDGPAVVMDGETGEREPASDSDAAHDRARELNAGLKRRRHFAMRA